MNKFLPPGSELLKTEKPYINLGKLAEGEYRFRIVQRPIAGWIDWKDKKPMRFRPDAKPKAPTDPKQPIKSFWALYVWDYSKEALHVMEVTQNSIKKALETLALNEDWGDLTSFDFKIKKEGTGIDSTYSIIPIPPKPLSQQIIDAVLDAPVRLEALYDGLDPWTDLEPNEPAGLSLNDEQCAKLDFLLNQLNDKPYQKELEAHLQVASIYNIDPDKDFKRAIRALEQRIESRKLNKEKAPHGTSRVA
jgi:hypothetical protein